jgi:hypothetical protein
MNDDVERGLRSVFNARAADVAAGPAPVQAIGDRARQLGRGRMLVASSTATAVVLVVVVAALTAGRSGGHSPAVGDGQSPTAPSPSAAASNNQSLSPTTRATASAALQIRTQADAVRRYLETADLKQQAQIGTSFHGRVYCGLDVLGRSEDGTRLFTWVLCEEYYDDAGVARLGSATAEALLVRVTGGGAQTVVRSVEAPQGGTNYSLNVRRLFNRPSADVVLAGRPIPVDQPDPTLAGRARADLAGGRLPGPAHHPALVAPVTGSLR